MPDQTSIKPKLLGNGGFTMVELLVVITLLAIISGISFNVINYRHHQDNALDAIRKNNVSKLVNVMETYFLSERRYPVDTNNDGIPSYTENPLLVDYLKGSWPNGEPEGAVYTYWVDASGSVFGIVVQNSQNDKAIKYRSTWGKIQDCLSGSPASTDACL